MNPWGPLPGTGRRVGYRMGAFSSHKKDRTLPKINGLGDPVPSWRLGFIPDPGVRILPESLPDGRAGFTRTLAVPVRSRCAGASRSCLPDDRNRITRAQVRADRLAKRRMRGL